MNRGTSHGYHQINDDLRGYAELNLGPIPISGGEHEYSLLGCAQLL